MTDAKPVLPGHETQSEEMNCPKCGRYAGAVTKCPYCGAKVEKRMSLMATRWAAVLLSTIGLFLLYLMAKHRDIPVVKLGEVTPTMNFGQIRVEGRAETDARTFKSGGMGFTVTDGTGSIMVFVSKKQAEDMAALNLVPKAGDEVSFAGGLNISDEESSMRLLSVKEFQLTRAPAASVRLADISHALKGQSVQIAGQVVELIPPPAGSKRPYDLKVKDDSGEQTINFWQLEYDQIPRKEALPGAWFRARVSVAAYKDELQLKLASGLDLEVLDAPPAPAAVIKSPAQQAAESFEKAQAAAPRDFSRGRLAEARPIAAITAADDGKSVKVRGKVISVRAPEAGTKRPFSLILADGEATLRVTYWSNVDEVMAVKPAPGAEFEIDGVVEVYQDKPQLKVESGYKVKQIAAAPAAAPVAPAVAVDTIAAITAADKGQARRVQGTLGAPRALGKGTAYALADASGSIDLILWDSIIPENVRAALKEGLQVSAEGVVGEYDGKLQLKANPGESVRAVNP